MRSARELVADLALDDFAPGGVLGRKSLERLDERAVTAFELLQRRDITLMRMFGSLIVFRASLM